METARRPATQEPAAPEAHLGPEVAQAVGDFHRRHGRELAAPEDVYERCLQIAELFTTHTIAAGVPARTISGCRFGADPHFGLRVVLAGHFATLVPARRAGTSGAWTGRIVVDWTAHQFDHAAQVPTITALEAWRALWNPLGRSDPALEGW